MSQRGTTARKSDSAERTAPHTATADADAKPASSSRQDMGELFRAQCLRREWTTYWVQVVVAVGGFASVLLLSVYIRRLGLSWWSQLLFTVSSGVLFLVVLGVVRAAWRRASELAVACYQRWERDSRGRTGRNL